MEEIKNIKVKLQTEKNEFKIMVLSDLHIGDQSCDLKSIQKAIDFIKNDANCYCILNGDLVNNALKDSKSDIYSEKLTMYEQQQLIIKLLEPIKDKILVISPGNHENRTFKSVGVDITLWMANRLGIEDKYANEAYLLNIIFGKNNNKNPYRYTIFGQHGEYGGGRRLGSAMNALEDLSGIVTNADCYIRSHTHQPITGRRRAFKVNDFGNTESYSLFFYSAPSFLNWGGYAARKGYKASDNSPSYLQIRAFSQREGTKLKNKYLTDVIML